MKRWERRGSFRDGSWNNVAGKVTAASEYLLLGVTLGDLVSEPHKTDPTSAFRYNHNETVSSLTREMRQAESKGTSFSSHGADSSVQAVMAASFIISVWQHIQIEPKLSEPWSHCVLVAQVSICQQIQKAMVIQGGDGLFKDIQDILHIYILNSIWILPKISHSLFPFTNIIPFPVSLFTGSQNKG